MAGLTGLNLIITRCNMLLYNQKLQAVARATTIFMPKPPCIPEISSIPMYPALSQSIDFWVIKQVKVFAQLLLLFFSFQPAIEPLVLIWIGGSMVWCKFNRTLLHSSRVGAFPRCLCAAIDPTCKKVQRVQWRKCNMFSYWLFFKNLQKRQVRDVPRILAKIEETCQRTTQPEHVGAKYFSKFCSLDGFSIPVGLTSCSLPIFACQEKFRGCMWEL